MLVAQFLANPPSIPINNQLAPLQFAPPGQNTPQQNGTTSLNRNITPDGQPQVVRSNRPVTTVVERSASFETIYTERLLAALKEDVQNPDDLREINRMMQFHNAYAPAGQAGKLGIALLKEAHRNRALWTNLHKEDVIGLGIMLSPGAYYLADRYYPLVPQTAQGSLSINTDLLGGELHLKAQLGYSKATMGPRPLIRIESALHPDRSIEIDNVEATYSISLEGIREQLRRLDTTRDPNDHPAR
jgi:hypothetical protein